MVSQEMAHLALCLENGTMHSIELCGEEPVMCPHGPLQEVCTYFYTCYLMNSV